MELRLIHLVRTGSISFNHFILQEQYSPASRHPYRLVQALQMIKFIFPRHQYLES